MKNFTSIILFLTICFASMAQTITETKIPFTRATPLLPAKNQQPINLKSKKHIAAGQRSATPISIVTNPNYTDSVYFLSNVPNGTYERFAPFRLGSGLPTDSFHNGDLRWVAAQFDTLIDINTGQGYSLANTPASVDSIYYAYSYQRQTAASVIDTLIINIYQGDIKQNKNSDSGAITNTILHSDTVLLDSTSIVTAGYLATLVDRPNYTFATPTNFSIGFDFRGDTTNDFFVIGGFGEDCGNACAAQASSITGNTQYDEINYNINKIHQFSTVIEFIFFPGCGSSNNYDSTKCELNYLQDLDLYTFLTITPPLAVNASASASVVCPGQSISITSAASGGTAPYTYSWTGTGAISSAFDSNTVVTAPTGGNPTDTLLDTLTVTDASSDIIVTVIKTFVKGVSVSAGSNDTIACGATVNLTALLTGTTGSLNGVTTVVQWVGDSLPGQTYLGVGPGTYTVNVTNQYGCTASSSVTISSVSGNTANFIASQVNPKSGHDTITNSLCANAVDTFVNTSQRIANWNWTWTYTGANTFNDTNLVLASEALPVGSNSINLVGDSSGCQVSVTKNVTVVTPSKNNGCLPTTGINELYLADRVTVFPNPTTGMFNISFDGIESNNANISVYDILGRNLFTETTFALNGAETKTIDLSKNANGIYFVRVQVDGQPYTIKVSLNK